MHPSFILLLRHSIRAALFMLLFSTGCTNSPEKNIYGISSAGFFHIQPPDLTKPQGNVVRTRFAVPQHFERIAFPDGSFPEYLRDLPLKPHGSDVKLYNGRTKIRQVHAAVIDRDPGNKNLHQCADAVIRLRAEYLYSIKSYDAVHFNLTNGFQVDYDKWMQGYRVAVVGNNTRWVKSKEPADSPEVFQQYLEFLYTYAGTLSLAKEMKKVLIADLQPGDVFIQGGSPGHAVIVVDAAVNASTGEMIFMLAQSYMPAQDIHILKNPDEPAISPWYRVDLSAIRLNTPEWTFEISDLKRF